MTRTELKEWLEQEKVDPKAYHLDGQPEEDTYTLRHLSDGRWAVFYTERGQEVDPKVFDGEHRACVELLYKLLRDHVSCPAAKQ